VLQLLIELDGADQRHGVYVIGATNRYSQLVAASLYIFVSKWKVLRQLLFWCRIDVIDEAVLRPGRFGKKHFVPLPGADERAAILKAHASKKPISQDVDLGALARREECNNLTGADLASLVSSMLLPQGVFEFVKRCINARLCFGVF
jgi:ribosome biogenesis ATPase